MPERLVPMMCQRDLSLIASQTSVNHNCSESLHLSSDNSLPDSSVRAQIAGFIDLLCSIRFTIFHRAGAASQQGFMHTLDAHDAAKTLRHWPILKLHIHLPIGVDCTVNNLEKLSVAMVVYMARFLHVPFTPFHTL